MLVNQHLNLWTLPPQGAELVLLMEDIAERDTNFFVELTLLGDHPVEAAVPSRARPADLAALMALARDIRPGQVVFSGGDLTLRVDDPPESDVQITAQVGQSVHLSHLPPLFTGRGTLRAGATEVSLGSLAPLAEAYHPLKLTLSIGDARVERSIAFALLRQTRPQDLPGDLAARKAAALEFAARNGEARIGRVLARFAAGLGWDAPCDAILDDTLDGINGRRDCSDFVLVPLLWLYAAHAAELPPAAADRIRQAILSYRYWMDEPGNDTMWFWSENHVLCFHVSQYIAGTLFPDQVFSNSGLTGADHRARAHSRLTRWFDSIKDHGLAEWNSAAYYPIDFIGLFGLYRWSDGPLKDDCRAVLDALFRMIALHTLAGVSAGTMGRAYDKELRAGPLSELPPFATVAFGQGWLNEGVAALPMFCACDYAPPQGIEAHARPAPGTVVQAHYIQGYGAAARLALWKTDQVQMSAAVDGPPGAIGHQQHLIDVQGAGHPFARLWINHPGEDDPWGHHRPSYWSGNGVMPRVAMDGNTCLYLNDLGPSARLPFTHAYAPLDLFDALRRGPDWIALQSGGGYVLAHATGPIETETRGPGQGLEHRTSGLCTGWAVIVGNLPAGGLDQIAEIARHSRLTLSRDDRALHLIRPDQPDLRLSYAQGLFRAGQPVPFPTRATLPQVQTARLA